MSAFVLVRGADRVKTRLEGLASSLEADHPGADAFSMTPMSGGPAI